MKFGDKKRLEISIQNRGRPGVHFDLDMKFWVGAAGGETRWIITENPMVDF